MNNYAKQLVAMIMSSLITIGSAQAVELITNGDFETGNFTGWTVTDLANGTGSVFIDAPGTTTPISGFATSATGGGAHGSFYAVSDQPGPGTHALSQSFTVSAGQTVILMFDLFVNDQSGLGPIIDPIGLDHTGGPNQHGRVDILSGSAMPFDTGIGVLSNLYLGIDAGPNPNPFTHYSFDISSTVAAGGTFQLRFAEVDNQLFFNFGVDNVSITTVPEPASLLLAGIGLVGMGMVRRKKKA